jgi:hypothetical protein
LSYYETYEFFAIDRLLSPDEMRALRAISTRAVITPARFYNFYNWGGLKGDPGEMLARYFDLFVHTGNGRPDWGMLRFPAGGIDLRRWRPYVTVQRDTRRSERAAAERAAAERAAAERRERLDALDARQEAEWSEIDEALDAPKVQATVYRDVIERLTELRELAEDRGGMAAYQERLRALLERHKRKPTLLRHVREARLIEGGENG